MTNIAKKILSISVAVSLVTVSAFAQDDGKIKIGAILTLSGSFAAAGDDSRRGIEAALATNTNSNPIQIIYADSKNDPSASISEYQKLTNIDKVVAVYTHRSSIGMALNPLAAKGKLPLIGAVGHQEFATNNQFAIQAWPRAHEEGIFVAEEFKRRNFKRVAVLYTEDEWTNSVTEGFRNKLKDLGMKLVFDEAALPSEQDFRTQASKLKQNSPDAIYFNLLLPQIAPAVKQARAINLSGDFFSNFYLAKKEVKDALGAQLEGVRYVELDNDLPNLKKQLGEDEAPPGLTVASYLSTLLLMQAAVDPSHPKTADDVMKSLVHQKEIRTSDGSYLIEHRCIKFPLTVKVMKNGQFAKEKAG